MDATDGAAKLRSAAALLARRQQRQREVLAFYARRRLRQQLVPAGVAGVGPTATASVEKVVLQKDALNVVGDHGSQTGGTTQVEVTRDADGGMRWWAAGSSGGVSDGDKGDIVVSSSGTVWTVDTGAIGTSKLGGDITTAGKNLLDDATAADQRTTLGLGTAATQASSAFAAASHTHAAGDITSGTIATARLGSGTANAGTYLRGDQTWATPPTGLADAITSFLVSGQSDITSSGQGGVVVELVAGTNITITTDDLTKQVTIEAAGGGGSLDDGIALGLLL